MLKRTILLTLLIAAIFLVGQTCFADPMIRYLYLTNFERTRFNEVIWFWSPDTIRGPIHSNDYLGIRYGRFLGQVSTSQDQDFSRSHAWFALEPISNAPVIEFPPSFPHLRQMANPQISSSNNQKMTWIRMQGERGIDIFQYYRGGPRTDSLVMHLEIPQYQVIYIDGEVEIEGILVGTLTVYSAGNIYLLDNCIYEGADPGTGDFEEDDMPHLLGLISDRNIIIKDTEANGRANGRRGGGNDMDRHSIIINAAMIALNESFTFEHHNDDWDSYQGPEPDERGQAIIKGSIAQYRRGYVHRSNHQGTGYGKTFNYDFRLLNNEPPGFRDWDRFIIEGRHDQLHLEDQDNPYQIRNADIGSLTVDAGVEIELIGPNPILIRNDLIMVGTGEEPIVINPDMLGERAVFRVDRGPHSRIEMNHVRFESDIITQITCDSLIVNNSEFNGEVNWEGTIDVTESTFSETATLTGWDRLAVSQSVFEDGLTISGNTSDGHLINNTIVKSDGTGLRLRSFRNLEITNNIIAFNDKGIHNSHFRVPNLSYNNVFGNEEDDYYYCVAGEGSISVDPQFVNVRRGDYHLSQDSPCIDTGNPNSPLDPDGTRADIGAFHFPQLDVDRVVELDGSVNNSGFELIGGFPNPFNSTTTIEYNLPASTNVSLRVLDLMGRQVAVLVDEQIGVGNHRVNWSPDNLGAGVYLVHMQAGEFNQISKVMFLK